MLIEISYEQQIITVVHQIIKIVTVFLLIISSALIAQDSSTAKSNQFKYSLAFAHLASNDSYNSVDNYSYPHENETQHMASQPTFVNSERLMLDGTTWRKYSDVDYQSWLTCHMLSFIFVGIRIIVDRIIRII